MPYTKVEESFGIQATHDFIYIGFPRGYQSLYQTLYQSLYQTSYQGIKSVVQSFPLIQSVVKDILPLLPVHSGASLMNETYQIGVGDVTIDPMKERWDHQDFPGVVYRSFLGPFVVSILTVPFTAISVICEDKMNIQVVSRIILSLFLVSGFNSYANSVGRKYGVTTRRSLIVLTLTQFHFMYYNSRTLPNTYALGLCLFSYSHWVRRQYTQMIMLVAVTVIIFRVETAILFGPIFFNEIFINHSLTVKKLLLTGIPAGIVSLATTILFDTYLWGTRFWLWPEGHSIYFNLYLNKSSEWGTSPFHWYFTSALPRALLFSIIFIPFATRRALKNFLLPSLVFVALYSLLPHKELRFILYVIPLLNTCAANAAAIMVEKFEGTKPAPESFLFNYYHRIRMSEHALTYEEEVAADTLQEEREREEEEIKARIEKNKLPPEKYDSIRDPYSSILNYEGNVHHGSQQGSVRNRKEKLSKQRNGVEAVLDEQYSKITAAVLEKHKSIDTILKSSSKKTQQGSQEEIEDETDTPESVSLSCSFIIIFILMGVHIWCNVACLVYASLASYNNYPGGEAITIVNHNIRSADLLISQEGLSQNNQIGKGSSKKFKESEIGVYVTNLAAQTGFTRFLQLDGVVYDKSPSLDHVANRTIFLRKGKGFNKHVTHDFSPLKVVYLVLEKIDVKFLQSYCVSTKSTTSSQSSRDGNTSSQSSRDGNTSSQSPRDGTGSTKSSTSNNSPGIESVVCNFGENAKNCNILKVVNGFNGIDLGLTSKNVVIKTAPMLWVFKCIK